MVGRSLGGGASSLSASSVFNRMLGWQKGAHARVRERTVCSEHFHMDGSVMLERGPGWHTCNVGVGAVKLELQPS